MLIILCYEVLVEKKLSIFSTSFISDFHGQVELQVESADLAQIPLLAAGLADMGPLVDSFVAFPLEDCEGAETQSALLSIVLPEHAHVGVFAIALPTGDREIGFLPALFVDS